MENQEKSKKIKLQYLWISRTRKEVFLSEVRECERIEFKKHDTLMEYVRACVECGYKVG